MFKKGFINKLLLDLQTLDGTKPGDTGSRRESSSCIFPDSSKEGYLNFRQLCAEKNKVDFCFHTNALSLQPY